MVDPRQSGHSLRQRSALPLALALLLGAGCPGSATIPLPQHDQGTVADLPTFDTHSWLGDLGDAVAPGCAAGCPGCCTASGACQPGDQDLLCGHAGGLCQDCVALGTHCEANTCKACAAVCSGKLCGDSDGCGGKCTPGSGCCTPACAGKLCGEPNGCGGTCNTGCCTPACAGKLCGDADGCGGNCTPGSGCCTPDCAGKLCGEPNGCGGSCKAGSGCCTPDCAGKLCGEPNGCGGSCKAGSGCCTPSCSNKACGASDGCGDTCDGSCAWGYQCSAAHQCVCGPSPHFKQVGGVCLPSCGQLLSKLGVSVPPGSCCQSGCNGLNGGNTWDCSFCCLNGC